jgi:hypothetical protein
MRKLLLVLTLVLICVPLIGGTASAQKDPFEPLIDPNAGTTTTTTTTSTTGSTGDTFTPPSVGSEGLANTGADIEPWVALAYGLIVVGGGALALARLQSPRPVRLRSHRPARR